MHRDTVYEWRKSDPVFADEYAHAAEDAADVLEAEALRRAMMPGGSDLLLIFLNKAARPGKFRDRVEHGGIGGGPIKLEMSTEDEEVARQIVERRFHPTEN